MQIGYMDQIKTSSTWLPILSVNRLCLGFNYLTGNYYSSLWVWKLNTKLMLVFDFSHDLFYFPD